jgi:hypothetical protein
MERTLGIDLDGGSGRAQDVYADFLDHAALGAAPSVHHTTVRRRKVGRLVSCELQLPCSFLS